MTHQEAKLVADAMEAVGAIEQWASAYPEEQFPLQDLKKANEVLAEHGICMSAMHGAWGRHITQGILNYLSRIRTALEELKVDV